MPKSEPKSDSRTCAICGKPQSAEYRPFCSRRCADVDLNRWLSGAYAIPVTETDDEDGARAGQGAADGSGGPSGQPSDPDI